MAAGAFALVLLSAGMHAGWNLVVKASGDRLVAAWAQVVLGAAVFLPVLAVSFVQPRFWPVVALSGVVHAVYGLLLVAAYDRGDLSLVYPVARGTAPLLVTVGAWLFLDDRVGVAGAVAIALITGGLLWVARRATVGAGLGWAVATGVAISLYTTIDAAAVRAGAPPLAYVTGVFVANAVVLSPIVLVRRQRRLRAALRGETGRMVAAGALSVGAYVLVMAAARIAPLGMVAAVRETSVVLGALGGWLLLREALGRARLAGAIAVAAGLVVMAVA